MTPAKPRSALTGAPPRRLRGMLGDTPRAPAATAAAVLLVLAGCAPSPPPPPPETTRSYANARVATYERLIAALQGRGIVASGNPASGLIRAEEDFVGHDPWVDCRRSWVVDQTSNTLRRQIAPALYRHLSLLIAVTGDDSGSRVEIELQFSEKLTDPFRNRTFDQPCASTGVLETLLLAAPAGGT